MTTQDERDELRRLDGERTPETYAYDAQSGRLAADGATGRFLAAAGHLAIPLADEVEGLQERVAALERDIRGVIPYLSVHGWDCARAFPSLAATGRDDAGGGGG